ncbi:hypothetical protein KBTX_00676 [wastewater metagenome]|uniref:Aminoglycoside phosphotransferase domain-containing protein n=2 Tax=unclassified sequences TaxID=12908 RepID=A0A5B8R8U6_9ZZZZ|nr:bifunctional aminoglycoside phosphotransferase/ATP-binding protein [Arhodomonas sp. KWT]QEA04368.1 putative protein [uncultured organism]
MTDQRAVIEFLADPGTHGLGAGEVTRIDTHSAVVFLAGERVYKIKRAVDLGFLDFSTLAARERFCRAEVELNRRTAPALYLGVSAVNRDANGRLTLDGPGNVEEYVVVLRRFEQDTLFDRMAARGGLDVPLMIRLADRIAAFHGEAAVVADGAGADAVRATVEGNRGSFAALPAGILDADTAETLTRDCLAAVGRLGGCLDRRARDGRVRRCHGDLHLRNICLFEGEPTVFDCIEFNRSLSDIDVLYDLAFLLMDLWHRDLPGLANAVFNRYLDRRDEADGVAALPLFMAMRAAIRAHVGARAAGVQRERAAGEAQADEARAYLALAARALEAVPPRLVAVGGFSGTGKSSLAYALAPGLGVAPGARVLRSDVFRKRRFGCAPEAALPDDAYRPEVSEAVYAGVLERAGELLADGHSVVLDMVFDRPDDRAAAEAVAATHGVPFTGFWLTAPRDVLVERVRRRSDDASDATVAVLDRQLARGAGEPDWRQLDATRPVEALRREAESLLAGPG